MPMYNGAPYQGMNYMGASYPTYYPQTYMGYGNAYANTQQNQPQQMQTQTPSVFGRMIAKPEDIAPADVPTTGVPAYFPVQDGSAIYMKHWNANGGIDTVRYIPEAVEEKPKEEPTAPILNEILDRLSKIEKTLSE